MGPISKSKVAMEPACERFRVVPRAEYQACVPGPHAQYLLSSLKPFPQQVPPEELPCLGLLLQAPPALGTEPLSFSLRVGAKRCVSLGDVGLP